jgi:hypothetical protein
MAQYLFMIYSDPAEAATMTQEGWDAMLQAHGEFAAKVEANGGKILSGEALAPPNTATTVRGQSSASSSITDGPFVETKESLGGFYLIETKDLDAAIDFARILPVGGTGGVEVRPVMDTSAG